MDARSTRQYWEGQYDALIHWSIVLKKFADQKPTSEQIKRLAAAARTKAVLIAKSKLKGDTDG